MLSFEQNGPIEMMSTPQWWAVKRFHCRGRRRERERASERETLPKNWSTDSETFSLVAAATAPGGHFGHSVLHGCMTVSCNVFHHDPLEDFREPSCSFPRIYLSHVCFRRVCKCAFVCECVVGSFDIRQQEELTDCVWEVGGRNSRGLNHVSLCNTHPLNRCYRI